MALYQRKDVKDDLEDSIFASRDSEIQLPKYRFPPKESDPKVILEVVKDELFLDGNARQNLATFCQTFEETEVHNLMDISINKNMIDKDEYPQTAAIEERCVHMIADLWHAPESKNTVGTSTVGSSEACMLGGLAMYWRWREKKEKAGKDVSHPNLVTGAVQVCWEKFCRYWDIELREVPMDRKALALTPESMLEYIDENTIGIIPTFGLTFTGKYEPVKALCDALDQLQSRKGIDLDIHVDAASGGFLAPFCAPDIPWDFQNPRVKSISASGHKFGLAPLGCGWVLWRDHEDLPQRLIFHVNYLGGNMAVFQLNFSRPAGQIISQYFEFLRLGREGYRKIHMNCYRTAQYLAAGIEKAGHFEILYDANPEQGIPALAWTLKKDANVNFTLFDFADKLRSRGWQVPAYSLPKNAEDTVVQRILVRQGFGLDMAELFMEDFQRTLDYFKTHEVVTPLTQTEAGGFNHAG